MMAYIRTAFLAAALVMGAAACGAATQIAPETIERAGEPDIILRDADDSRMVKATQQARESMEQFWATMDAGEDGNSEFIIKAGLPTNDDSLEHIWVDTLSRSGDVITGYLSNEPYNLAGGLAMGDEVNFGLDDVTDWSYWEGNKMRGHFTTRILIEKSSPEEIAEVMQMMHEEPLP